MKNCLISLTLLYSQIVFSQQIDPILTYFDRSFTSEVSSLQETNSNAIEFVEDTSSGYSNLSVRKVFLSAGGSLTQSISLGGDLFAYIGLGLFPSYNSYAKYFKLHQNREEIFKADYTLPTNSHQLKQLKIGEWTFWSSQGGMTFHTPFGIGQHGIGPKYAREGGFSFYVERKNETEVYVEIKNIKSQSFGVLAGNFVAFAEINRIKKNTKGFYFQMDLTNPEHLDAYDLLVAEGKLEDFQQMENIDVKTLGSQSNGREIKFGLGTPFIPIISFRRSRNHENTNETREGWNGEVTTQKKSVAIKRRTRRFFKRRDNMDHSVMLEDGENPRGQLFWKTFSNAMTTGKLRKDIGRILNLTGLQDELNINYPISGYKIFNARAELLIEPYALKNELKTNGGKLAQKSRQLSALWRNSSQMKSLISELKNCGGKVQLKVAGLNIKTTKIFKEFTRSKDCVL